MGLERADIRTAWEAVRRGMEQIRTEMRADWRLEDIYALCLWGKATLYTAPEGFVILVRMENEFTAEPYLYVLACHGAGPVQERYWPELERIAREAGCRYVECLSPRRGFERTGWDLEHVCYRRRLDDGQE
jgi:hypothetical protein